MAFKREALSDLLDDDHILAAWRSDRNAQRRWASIDEQVANHCGYEDKPGYYKKGGIRTLHSATWVLCTR
jgi:hypothetical protein